MKSTGEERSTRLHTAWQILGPAAGLLLVLLIFSVTADGFLTLSNFRTTLIQTVIVGLGALGMTFVIVSGGIDLSTGSMIALSSVVTALLLRMGVPPGIAVLGGVSSGAACGLLNGLMITRLRIAPFIATLGMFLIARGMAKYLAGNSMVRPNRETFIDDLLARNPEPAWLLAAPAVWILFLLTAAMVLLLSRTVFGTHVYAIGSNEATARLCGVNVLRTKVLIYTLAGAFAGLAGVALYGRLGGMGDPTGALGIELEVIAAVVIGGASLAGGEGRIGGALLGAFLMSFLASGCRMLDIPNYVQEIITGCIIVIAVAIDSYRHRSP